VVTIGFVQTNESVAEDVGTVSVHAIIISGTLERELCVVISPVPGSALGMVLCVCEKMGWQVSEYTPVPSFRYSLLKEIHLRCAYFQEKYHSPCVV